MTSPNITNASGEEEAAIEALAIWHCNRKTRAIQKSGGASSWFDECLPSTQENYRDWASQVLTLIAVIKGIR